MNRIEAETRGQPWLVHMVCCGYDDGWWFATTWKAADEFRESYCAAANHVRTAIVLKAALSPKETA